MPYLPYILGQVVLRVHEVGILFPHMECLGLDPRSRHGLQVVVVSHRRGFFNAPSCWAPQEPEISPEEKARVGIDAGLGDG